MKNQALFSIINSTYLLAGKTQNYHWNVSGEAFYQLHKLFEEQCNDLIGSIDALAEQIVMEGEKVPPFLGENNIVTKPQTTFTAKEMVKDILEGNKAILNLITQQNFSQNPVVEALLQDRILAHKKAIWFLTAILS